MAKKVKESGGDLYIKDGPNVTPEVKNEPQISDLDANDINILYTLVQQATIKVSDVPAVAPVLDKCVVLLEAVNQKVNG
jgi:hypothetical protein